MIECVVSQLCVSCRYRNASSAMHFIAVQMHAAVVAVARSSGVSQLCVRY